MFPPPYPILFNTMPNKKYPQEELTVVFPDGTKTFINPFLLVKQGVTDDNLTLIRHSHVYKWQLYKEMEEAHNPKDLQVIAKKVEELEFYQQELWGFPKDACRHKFWLMPQCECPKISNEEKYGSGYVEYADFCPIHGEAWVGKSD